LNVDAVDLGVGADAFGDAQGQVADAGSDIGDGLAAFEVEGVEHLLWCLFPFAFGAFEPVGSAHSHDGGDLSTGDGVFCLPHQDVIRDTKIEQQ